MANCKLEGDTGLKRRRGGRRKRDEENPASLRPDARHVFVEVPPSHLRRSALRELPGSQRGQIITRQKVAGYVRRLFAGKRRIGTRFKAYQKLDSTLSTQKTSSLYEADCWILVKQSGYTKVVPRVIHLCEREFRWPTPLYHPRIPYPPPLSISPLLALLDILYLSMKPAISPGCQALHAGPMARRGPLETVFHNIRSRNLNVISMKTQWRVRLELNLISQRDRGRESNLLSLSENDTPNIRSPRFAWDQQ
ncbi:hypothetical protein EVAR_90615_1 [Eumeta japonica]|uniref:Uncharacterized protein n=1 Tax=Eumeta variegata TaxID=151549 RepID=A0A4C1ZR37_EUMVA|nr:hypothetical protein EVAR_90615_1 [Eumeta japonica]